MNLLRNGLMKENRICMNNSKISRNKKVKTEMPVKIGFPLNTIMYQGENYKSVNAYKYKSTILLLIELAFS